MFRRLLSLLDPILTVSVIISITVAIILVLIGQDQAISLLIGLVLTIITIQLDSLARQRSGEERMIDTLGLHKALLQNPPIGNLVQQIAHDYASVEQVGFTYFRERAHDALLECREVVHSLAEGRMIIPSESKFSYGRRGIESARTSIRAVACAKPDWWKTNIGQAYFQANVNAVERGVRITRIWIYDEATLIDLQNVIMQQHNAGIETHVILPDQLPRDLLEDYMIVDEQILIKLELLSNSYAKSEVISTNEIEVDRARSNYSLLLRYAIPFSQHLNQREARTPSAG